MSPPMDRTAHPQLHQPQIGCRRCSLILIQIQTPTGNGTVMQRYQDFRYRLRGELALRTAGPHACRGKASCPDGQRHQRERFTSHHSSKVNSVCAPTLGLAAPFFVRPRRCATRVSRNRYRGLGRSVYPSVLLSPRSPGPLSRGGRRCPSATSRPSLIDRRKQQALLELTPAVGVSFQVFDRPIIVLTMVLLGGVALAQQAPPPPPSAATTTPAPTPGLTPDLAEATRMIREGQYASAQVK